MERQSRPDEDQSPRSDRMMPNGGVSLEEERRRFLLPQWEGIYQTMRRMDGLELGETEPATVFAWEEQR